MERYEITGMSCAACSARVEKAVKKLDGVTGCSVSLLTNSMGVEGTATEAEIVAAVEKVGYGAKKQTGEGSKTRTDDPLKDEETPALLRRLLSSVGFLLALMYVSMGHVMWGWRLPRFFDGNPIAVALVELLLTIVVLVINRKFFISGVKGVMHGAPNMDTLVALGAGAAFAYSTYALFRMTTAANPAHYLHELYFESAAMILTLITVGKTLEARSKGRTTNALKSLMRLAPETAVLLVDGEEKTVSVAEVKAGDIFLVKPGARIPVDGEVLDGGSAVNESALTGESIPVDKSVGDFVSAGTINVSGAIACRAKRVGEDTTLSQIIRMVSEAAATKAPVQKIADFVSGIFVPVVIGLALIATVVWLFVGESFGYALARGISVLVVSCPCALGLATPVAIMVGNGVGAKNGILFKTAESIEIAGKTQIVALDKTGTITCGEPEVTDLLPADGITETELLAFAYTLEKNSEHPLAKAVVSAAEKRGLAAEKTEEFTVLPGNGLTAVVNGGRVWGGSVAFIGEQSDVPDSIGQAAARFAEEGKTPLLFATEEKTVGLIAVADTLKKESPQAIAELKNMGIRVVMLTGDNERTAQAIGKQAGVDEVIAGVLPDGKERVVRELQKRGRVAMVGDGINDAPALTRADVGIAIGAGTDVAIDAADVVLVKSRLTDVPAAIRLSRRTLKNIAENLFWAFFYNVVGIPLAAGVWIPLTGWEMNPMFGAAAMSLSSFCVVMNALRLNLVNVHDGKRDKKRKTLKTAENITEKENDKMTVTMKIEGMMCGHCEARVKKALEKIDGVTLAEVSHEKGTAVVTLGKEIPFETLKAAVEEQDYKVL